MREGNLASSTMQDLINCAVDHDCAREDNNYGGMDVLVDSEQDDGEKSFQFSFTGAYVLEDADRAGVTESHEGQEVDSEDGEDLEDGEDFEDLEDLEDIEDCEDQAFIEAATQLEDVPSTTAANENTNEQSTRQMHERVIKERLKSLPATLRRLCECNDIAKEKSGQHPSSRQRKMGQRLKKVASNILALYRHETWTYKYVVSPITRVVLDGVMKTSQTRADFIQLCEDAFLPSFKEAFGGDDWSPEALSEAFAAMAECEDVNNFGGRGDSSRRVAYLFRFFTQLRQTVENSNGLYGGSSMHAKLRKKNHLHCWRHCLNDNYKTSSFYKKARTMYSNNHIMICADTGKYFDANIIHAVILRFIETMLVVLFDLHRTEGVFPWNSKDTVDFVAACRTYDGLAEDLPTVWVEAFNNALPITQALQFNRWSPKEVKILCDTWNEEFVGTFKVRQIHVAKLVQVDSPPPMPRL